MLPQLLTGSGLTPQATGLTVAPDGTVRLAATQTVIPQTAGTTIVSGWLDAASLTAPLLTSAQAQGGTVQILGDRVGLFSANVNASGVNGGWSLERFPFLAPSFSEEMRSMVLVAIEKELGMPV